MKNQIEEILKTNFQDNFADYLLKLENKTATQDQFDWLLEVLPPVITNYEEGKGFSAYLGGEALDTRFCKIAQRETPIYLGYAKTTSGQIMELIMSVQAFKHYFKVINDEPLLNI